MNELLIKEWAKWHTDTQPPMPSIYANWQSESMARYVIEVVLPKCLDEFRKIRSIDEYHEGCGCALWHHLPISEPPYVGSPLDAEFDFEYYTHWQKMVRPDTEAV